MREDCRLELKREYTTEIRRTVIAFANCDGGSIYIGIENDGNVVGVSDADDIMLRLASNIKDSISPDVSLLSEISVEEIEGRNVVRIDVMRGAARPYYLKSKGPRPEGVFVRSGSATVPADPTTILEMIKCSSGFSYEKELSLVQTLTYDYSSEVFSVCGLELTDSAMRNLGAINENGQYTNLALLLSDQCPHIIKLATFQGRDKRIFKDRMVADGSVFKQIDTAVEYIKKYNRLRAEIVQFKREDHYDYSMDSVRELLYNAVIHRDYSYDSPIILSVLDDRIEIVNIGGLYGGLSVNELGTGISACRNKNLAEVFYRLKLVEAFGTGIIKIRAAYEGYIKQPEFKPGHNSFLAVLPNMNIEREESYDNMLRENMAYNLYGQCRTRVAHLSEREAAALELTKTKGSIVRSDLEEELGISQATAILLLRELTEKQLLKKEGAGKNTRYTL